MKGGPPFKITLLFFLLQLYDLHRRKFSLPFSALRFGCASRPFSQHRPKKAIHHGRSCRQRILSGPETGEHVQGSTGDEVLLGQVQAAGQRVHLVVGQEQPDVDKRQRKRR